MRSIANRMVLLLVALIMAALTSAGVFAKSIRKEVTFANPVTVNGTLVKTGTYDVTFDDETNQLVISKGKKVIAKVEARIEKFEGSQNVYVTHLDSDDAQKPAALVSIALNEGNRVIIVNNGDNKVVSTQ